MVDDGTSAVIVGRCGWELRRVCTVSNWSRMIRKRRRWRTKKVCSILSIPLSLRKVRKMMKMRKMLINVN